MCGAILRPFNSISDISCRWEGGIELCVIAPVYSMEDCRLQLIPGTASLNLLSYRNSNSFQTWPCRYNNVHLIQCDHTHNLIHLLGLLPLLLSITSQLVIRNWLLVISSWFLVITSWLLVITSWLLVITSWLLVVSSWFFVITSWLLVITSWLLVITSCLFVITSWFLVNTSWFLIITS